METESCCILNGGGGSWAFETLARQLSEALWVDVAQSPREFNYLLHSDHPEMVAAQRLFIPIESLERAADKRRLAEIFAANGVPTPETHLLPSLCDAKNLLLADRARDWCLKFPTGCGASGHRMLTMDTSLPVDWPLPLVVQEFVRMEQPEVYRLYAAGGRVFGWVARRFPASAKPSPWVAHVRGARYEAAGRAPSAAVEGARAALKATGLLDAFGCADLIRRQNGEWVVLEVGTDGMCNHVDRELGLPELELEIQQQIAEAFWSRLGTWRPWGNNPWRIRTAADPTGDHDGTA